MTKNDLTNDKKWQKNDKKMTPQNRNDKKMQKPNDKKMTKINNQQPSEFAGKIFIRLHWIHWGMMSSHSHFLYPMSWSQ